MADHELVETLRRLRYDLTAMQMKVSEALRMAGALQLNAVTVLRCGWCGVGCRSERLLREHFANVHGVELEEEAPRFTESGAECRKAHVKGYTGPICSCEPMECKATFDGPRDVYPDGAIAWPGSY